MDTPPPIAAGYSQAFDRALMVAAIVHARQKRKGTDVPYVMHPMHVAMLLARHGFDGPVLVAAALHDVLEDVEPKDLDMQRHLRETFPALQQAPEDPEEFRAALRTFVAAEFGAEVATLVDAVTDRKYRADGTKLPWHEAKQLSHERLANPATPLLAVVLKAADALHNSRQIANDLRAKGMETLKRFNAPPEGTLAHYVAVWRIARARVAGGVGASLVDELERSVGELSAVLQDACETTYERVRDVAKQLGAGPAA